MLLAAMDSQGYDSVVLLAGSGSWSYQVLTRRKKHSLSDCRLLTLTTCDGFVIFLISVVTSDMCYASSYYGFTRWHCTITLTIHVCTLYCVRGQDSL